MPTGATLPSLSHSKVSTFFSPFRTTGATNPRSRLFQNRNLVKERRRLWWKPATNQRTTTIAVQSCLFNQLETCRSISATTDLRQECADMYYASPRKTSFVSGVPPRHVGHGQS